MGVASAQRALCSASVGAETFDPSRVGVSFASDYVITTPEELCAAVAEALPGSARIIDKPTFGSAALAEAIGGYVREYGAENVHTELIGLCTDICVVSNALLLKAFYPEMPLAADSACCAGVTPASHEAALTTMKMCQIDII